MKKLFNILLTIALTAVFVFSAGNLINSIFNGNFSNAIGFLCVILVLMYASGAFKRSLYFNAVVTTLTRFSSASENNSYTGRGILSYAVAYAATSALVLKAAYRQYVCYAQLTGAMTINATLTNLKQFDEIVFFFDNDATQRIVTFGTGFLSSGTVTIPISKGATVVGIFDGTAIRIVSREIYA
jgi:hypothetical protein